MMKNMKKVCHDDKLFLNYLRENGYVELIDPGDGEVSFYVWTTKSSEFNFIKDDTE